MLHVSYSIIFAILFELGPNMWAFVGDSKAFGYDR